LISAKVTLIAGGYQNPGGSLRDFNLYSPDGDCSKNLSSLPDNRLDGMLGYAKGDVIYCGFKECWKYILKEDKWVSLVLKLKQFC
jgi:hypothetical protein